MAIGSTEKEILKVVAEARRASKGSISRRLRLTLGYAEYLCKVLVRDRYLAESGSDVFTLAQRGKKVLIDLGFASGLDQAFVKDLAAQVAKAVGQELREGKGGVVRQVGPVKEVRERPLVEIQTEYLPPTDEELAQLTSNIGELGIEAEEEKDDISESVRLFRNISKGERGKRR